MKYFYIFFAVINVYALMIMYIDKQKAIKKRWRIPEIKLFFIAFILGSPGILAGMFIFHHKTKHLKFLFGIPAIMLLQILILLKFKLI